MFKRLVLAASLVFAAGMSHAASCGPGTCDVNGADGQFLSSRVHFDINEIVGDGVTTDGGSGAFEFSASFINDTTADGAAVAAFLVSTTQGSITDLFLNIVAPAGIVASYALASDVLTTISLASAGAPPQTIEFTLTGTATRGTFGGNPDINLTIAAVPLPAGMLLFGTALAGFGIVRRRHKAS